MFDNKSNNEPNRELDTELHVLSLLRDVYSRDPLTANESLGELIGLMDILLADKNLHDEQKGKLIVEIYNAYAYSAFSVSSEIFDYEIDNYQKALFRAELLQPLASLMRRIVKDPETSSAIYGHSYNTFDSAAKLFSQIVERDTQRVVEDKDSLNAALSILDSVSEKRIYVFRIWWMFREILECQAGNYRKEADEYGENEAVDERTDEPSYAYTREEAGAALRNYNDENFLDFISRLKDEELYECINNELYSAPDGYYQFLSTFLSGMVILVDECESRGCKDIFPKAKDIINDLFFSTVGLNPEHQDEVRVLAINSMLPSLLSPLIIEQCARMFIDTPPSELAKRKMNVPLEFGMHLLSIRTDEKLMSLGTSIVLGNLDIPGYGLRALRALDENMPFIEDILKRHLEAERSPAVRNAIETVLSKKDSTDIITDKNGTQNKDEQKKPDEKKGRVSI